MVINLRSLNKKKKKKDSYSKRIIWFWISILAIRYKMVGLDFRFGRVK